MHRNEIKPFRGNTETHLRQLERMAARRGDVAPIATTPADDESRSGAVALDYAPPPETRRERNRRWGRAVLSVVSEPVVLATLLCACGLVLAIDPKTISWREVRLLGLLGGSEATWLAGFTAWARYRRVNPP